MIKALVIGGNGFIGSHLVDRLLNLGWDVAILDIQERRYDPMPSKAHFIRGDLSQSYLMREALIGVDVVFHLAWATIHEVSNQDPAADVNTNLIPSIQLIDASRRSGVRRFVFISSGGTVYGPVEEMPISEGQIKRPVTGYGITKLAVEKYLHMFNHLHGLDYAVLRPSVPYGPRQNPLGRQGAIAVFLHHVAKGLPITIWGEGQVTRDYFYISDLVDALVAGAEQPLDDERVFNLGGGREISLNGLLVEVEKTVGKKAIVEYQPARGFDAPRILLDTDLAQRTLGWHPQVSLERGLEYTWDWMREAIRE